MKVLVTSSNDRKWTSFVEQLRRMNHEVLALENCSQVLTQLIDDSAIDVVILDVSYSDKCALKLLSRRQNDRRLLQVPIILAATGFTHDQIAQFRSLSAFEFLVLPIGQATLESKLLRGQREGKKAVLVVDDEPEIADILSEHLKLERYRVLTANSAETALEILRQERISAVVTDIMMSGMSGLELMAEVKATYAGVPVIVMTGYSGKFTPSEVIAAGADGFFAKPFKNLELTQTLAQVLARYASKNQSKHSPSAVK